MHSLRQKALRSTQGRRARGSAMVEFVILNIILVPLFLYAIFLMDAAYLKLDLQETVISGVWDFTTRNTEPGAFKDGGLGAPSSKSDNDKNELATVAKAVRIVYADHTSAVDDGADPFDGTTYSKETYLRGNGDGSQYPSQSGHKKHHTGFGAQYSFRFVKKDDVDEEEDEPTDTQFQCGLSEDLNWTVDFNMKEFASTGYNTGGEVRCWAKGYIYNYIIPSDFMQEFSQVEMSKMKLRKDTTGKGVHEWQGDGGDLENIVAYETASVSFNTWALRNGAKNGDDVKALGRYNGALASADLRVPKSAMPTIGQSASSPEANPFFRRVQYLYTSNGTNAATYTAAVGATAQLTSKGTSEKLMLVLSVPPGTSSNNVLPNIIGVHLTARYKPRSPGQKQGAGLGSGDFLSTPYSGPNNNYRTAANARGPFYMGCRNAENANCF
ncbi:TadE/TadG family type IV pilus assembly protein [Hyalangium versicolor]|uniref:TadE/TadG family type IV pilus assembly protein n=1 Tax=Hyalangium versicolor TaxID=2861190 RepID=UPI001CCA2CC0|nr:hypothetical protein [Hyalangium versicolor]